MIDKNKMLECCKECDQECKLNQWQFDSVFKMSGCILADVEMFKIMNSESEETE